MPVSRFGTTAPHRPATRTRAGASRRVAVRERADDRAEGRAAMAAYVRQLRQADPGLSVAAAHDALRTAVATRGGPFADPDVARCAKVPRDPSTVWRWLGRAGAAETAGGSVTDALADAPGKGRTRTPLPEPVRAEVERLAGLKHKVRAIIAHAQQFAADHAHPRPTAHKIRYAIDDLGLPFHTAAAQGSQAARLDAVPHAAVPVDHPHETWTGDTFQFPIPKRGYDPAREAAGLDPYYAVWCEGVVFVDNRSTAIVGYYLCDPESRRDDVRIADRAGTGRTDADATEKATAVEVLGALLSAALPDLAPSGTRDVAGRLPSKGLRLDVKCQQQLRGPLARIQLAVPELPGNYPSARGIIEEVIGAVKGRMAALPGAAPVYSVATQSEAADARDRVRNAPKRVRPRPTIHIAPRDLPDITTLRRIFDEVVRAYNHDPRPATNANPRGWSPVARLRAEIRDTHGRPGTDALRLMAHGNVLVSRGSLVHRGVAFAASPTLFVPPADGSPVVGFGVGTAVEFRADPLLRGVFAFPKHARVGEPATIFLPRLADASRAADPAAVAKALKGIAREGSKRARAARKATQEQDLGLDGLHRAGQAGTMAEQERELRRAGLAKSGKRKGRTGGKGALPGAPASQPNASPKAAQPPPAATAAPATSDAATPGRAKPQGARRGAHRAPEIAVAGTRPAQIGLALTPGVAAMGTPATGTPEPPTSLPAPPPTPPAPPPAPTPGALPRPLATQPALPSAQPASPPPPGPPRWMPPVNGPVRRGAGGGPRPGAVPRAGDPRERVRRLALPPPLAR